jgi:hypothetical protein
MRVFLDDVRFGNEYDLGDRWYEWVVVRTFENCKLLLDAGIVTEMSLDYSLVDTDPHHTGEDVLRYILQKMDDGNFEPPYITVHSKHSLAETMLNLLQEIKRKTTTLVDIDARTAIAPYVLKHKIGTKEKDQHE